MFKAILLPVDDTELSLRPMKPAIALSRLTGARIIALSVAEPRLLRAADYDDVGGKRDIEEIKQEKAKNNAINACNALTEAGIACESAVTMSAEPEDEIVRAARQYGCDLIMMATRAEMGIIDTIFGESITQAVIRKSPVPVLVFP